MLSLLTLIGLSERLPAQSTALVQIRINAAYDDSYDGTTQLRELLPYLPARQITVSSGTTVSGVIAFQYGFGASDLPRTYAIVEADILRRNGNINPVQLRPGKLFIPLLPKWALAKPNPSKSLNYVPKLEIWNTYSRPQRAGIAEDLWAAPKVTSTAEGQRTAYGSSIAADFTVTGFPELLDQGRRAAREVIEELRVPESVLPAFLAKFKVASAFDYRMRVRLASAMDGSRSASDGQQPASSLHQVLTDSEHAFIRDFLADSAAREVVLLVADTGWPDDATYRESRAALRHMFDVVRSANKLGSSWRPPDKAFQEPINPHCKQISQALTEFRNLDRSGKVKVIYVPLLPEQDSAALLRELLEIYFLQNQMGTNLGLDSVDSLPADVRTQAKKEAARIVSKLQPSWTSSDVTSDEAIISAYLSLLNLYSQQTNRPSFLSESWTLPNRALIVQYPDPLAGLVVAAAGNERGLDFVTNERDFAERCARHKDTIAVIGLDQSGNLQCDSSATAGMLNSVMAVGFDGQVTTGVCGTSFATPRVAWLLAAAETKDSGYIIPTWENALYQRITAGRTAAGVLQQLWFDSHRFLSGAQPP